LHQDADVEQPTEQPNTASLGGSESGATDLPQLASEAFVCVPLPDYVDIDAFKSEYEVAEGNGTAAAPHDSLDEFVPRPARAHSRPSHISVSIADLIENHVRLEWHEAVAIAQRLCAAIARESDGDVERPLIEPWNVEITDDGKLTVLPGVTDSDPAVKQVGRVLRALLQETMAPAELRLIASQACFEIPFYSSIAEFSAALKRFERPDSPDPIRDAFTRAVEAKFSVTLPPERQELALPRVVAAPPAAWPPKALPAPRRPQPGKRSLRTRLVAIAGAIAVSLTARGAVYVLREVSAPPEDVASPVEPLPKVVHDKPAERPAPPPVTVSPPPEPPSATDARTTTARAASPRSLPRASRPGTNPMTPPPTVRRPAPIVAAGPPNMVTSAHPLETAERRATALLAAGDGTGASILFDSIVMRDPVHRLDPANASPEAVSALRRSKQTLVPTLARRHYDLGRSALESGDFALAIAEAERAMTMLDDEAVDAVAADLKPAVHDLVSAASAAKVREEEKIYTTNDSAVVPPRPLGRQLAAAPAGQESQAVGRLEILVNRAGRVERVTLHTPTNAYHDRMIVSAAKAWHYKPALKNGKAVRFSLVLPIYLPEPQ
jgi:hypothetical protein